MTTYEISEAVLLILLWIVWVIQCEITKEHGKEIEELSSRLSKAEILAFHLAKKLQRAEEQSNIAFTLISDHRHNSKCHTQDPTTLEV